MASPLAGIFSSDSGNITGVTWKKIKSNPEK